MHIGMDIVSVARWEKMLQVHPGLAARLFTEEEIAHCEKRGRRRAESYAGLWAAREAAAKALGTGFAGASWKDASVSWGPTGEPKLSFRGVLKARADVLGGEAALSISHEREYAAAVVIIAGGKS